MDNFSVRGLCLLGSTGSIGTQTLEIVTQHPERFRVISLCAGKNLERLKDQIRKFNPEFVSVESAEHAAHLRREFPGLRVEFGTEGLKSGVALEKVDMVVVGVVGFTALVPTLEAIRHKKALALANKEVLVVAGALFKREAAKYNATIIPVDSEHNALYQILRGCKREEVDTIILTASGGPLLRRPDFPLNEVTPAIATAHPKWSMGPKISTDSATLMNKGLELIEAHFLFDVPPDSIEVWIHPQSIVHGAVRLVDGTLLTHWSLPNMKGSIGFALGFPERLANLVPRLGLKEMANLEFLELDNDRFPAVRLSREALKAGPSSLVVLNAANEVAVESFLNGKLIFSKIPEVISEALHRHSPTQADELDAIIEIDAQARRLAADLIG